MLRIYLKLKIEDGKCEIKVMKALKRRIWEKAGFKLPKFDR